MLKSTFFDTKDNNSYVYSFAKNYILFSHPLIKYFYENEFVNSSEELLKKNIEKIGYSLSEINYYKEKYKFLKKSNFFTKSSRDQYINGEITADDIENELANLKTLVFEITEKCNLNCAYCFYGNDYNQYKSRNNKDFDLQDAIAVLDYLKSKWTSKNNISLSKEIHIGFYGGEPLINFSFVKTIVEYLIKMEAETQLSFRFVMTTNGTLLHKYMDYLSKHNFILTISIDGDRYSNSYRLFKDNTESFDQVFNNIKDLKQKHPLYFKKNVHFNAVLHDRNNYLDIYRFIKAKFNKEIRGTPVNPLLVSNNKFKNNFVEFNLNKNEELQCFLSSGTPLHYNMFLKNYSNFHFEKYDDIYFFNKKKLYYPTGTCKPFSKRMFITAKGKILPCETIGHEFTLGNIENGKINIDFGKVAYKYNNLFKKIKNKCNKCYRVKFCTECLFLNIIKENKIMKCNFLSNNGHSKMLSDYYNVFEENQNLYLKIWKEVRYV